MFVSREYDPDVNITGVCLLLPQKVVDPSLDVGAQPGSGETLGCEPVVFPLSSSSLVAAITLEPGRK